MAGPVSATAQKDSSPLRIPDRAAQLDGSLAESRFADILALERAVGNRVISESLSQSSMLVQRKCGCGNSAGTNGICEDCRRRGHSRGGGMRLSKPSDSGEREADQAAAQVMQGKTPRIGRRIEEDEVGRKAACVSAAGQSPATLRDSVFAGLRSQSSTIDPVTRAFMETRFSRDFGQVRIHTNSTAAESAAFVNARAYTVGQDIVFGQRQYAPSTYIGRQLLAHELVHTVQNQASAQSDVVRRQFKTFTTHGGGLEGIMNRDRQRTFDPHPHIVSYMQIDLAANRVVLHTSGGHQHHGFVSTDLEEGNYTLKPDTSAMKWNIQEEGGGRRFTVSMLNVDPWQLAYSGVVTLQVGSGNTTPMPASMSLKERLDRLKKILGGYVVGDTETEVLDILETTPPEQTVSLIAELEKRSVGGENYLSALDSALDGDNNLRFHEIISMLRIRSMDPEKGMAAIANAPVLPWHDVMGLFETKAVFAAKRQKDGKIKVKYLGAIVGGLRDDKRFKAEMSDLPNDLTVGGKLYDPEDVIIIHDYDRNQYVMVTAGQLVGYQHLGVRNWLGNMATVASLAMPLSAARTIAGKAAVLAAERILPAMVVLVNENRLNLVEWFPTWGPRMIYASRLVEKALLVYGLASLVKSGWHLVKSLKEIRQARKLKGATAEAEQLAQKFEADADNLIAQAEKFRKAEGVADAVPAATKEVPASPTADIDIPGGPKGAVRPGQPIPKKSQPPKPPAKQAANNDDIFEGIATDTRKALEANPRAARALKKCNSPCKFPKFAEPEHVIEVERIISRAEKHGLKLDIKELQKYIHLAKDSRTLNLLILELAETLDDALARAKSAGKQAMDEAQELAGTQSKAAADTFQPPVTKTNIVAAHEAGVTGGRKYASEVDGIELSPWDNPRAHIPEYGRGIDDLGMDGKDVVVLEWKGDSSKLSGDQMSDAWVGRKIAELMHENDPMAHVLLDAVEEGRLTGRVYRTKIQRGGKLQTKQVGATRRYDNDAVRAAFHKRFDQLRAPKKNK